MVDDLVAKILAKPRGETLVPFPLKHPETGDDLLIPMWVLTGEETILCHSKAADTLNKKFKGNIPKDGEDKELYEAALRLEQAKELLAIACRHPDDTKQPLFRISSDVIKVLNPSDIGILINHYNDIVVNLPNLMSDKRAVDDVIKEWSERLVRSAQDSGFLFSLNSWQLGPLKALIAHSHIRQAELEARVKELEEQVISLTPKSSSGTQPDNMSEV